MHKSTQYSNSFKTNNNINSSSVIITTNWEQYLPDIIYDILFVKNTEEKKNTLHPQHIVLLEKKEQEKEILLQKVEETKRLKKSKKDAEQQEKNTPGTKKWYKIYFPGKLWPHHPLSDELNLEWGLVQVTNSLYIKGKINGIDLESVTAFKQSCGKKSKGGGKFRKRSKEIKRKPCTGFGVDLYDIKKLFEKYFI